MIFLSLLWTLILPAQTPYDRRLEETQQKLQQMERELHQTRSRLEKLRRERANVASQEVALTQEMLTLARMLRVLDQEATLLQRRIDFLQQEIFRLDSVLGVSLDRLVAGMIFLYRWPDPHPLEIALDAENLFDAFYAWKSTDQVLRYYRSLYDRALDVERRLEQYRAVREASLQELKEVRKGIQTRRDELVRARREKQRLLVRLSEQERKEAQRVARLESSIRELESLIKKILAEREAARARAPEAHGRGRPLQGRSLRWPVDSRKVVSRYGTLWHPKYRTRTRNSGIDLQAGARARVYAVDAGEVVFSDVFLGYGGMVIVDHDGFYSLYAHLQERRVRKGDRVRKGQVLGRLDARGVLHFEIRIGGRAVNPLIYLP